ncbi:hypothetical protein AB0I22_35970 [Streptomyces sp. NPDC050610]|uniref:hypothetical protein n=1 Tax=Streptomyces sp. NPDC050610 TaxID=3157097 RepID=UPI00343AAA78
MITLGQDHTAARLLTADRAAAHAAEDEWWRRGVALFLVGPSWDAVKLPAPLVHAVADGSDVGRVRAILHRLGVTGPVFLHRETYVVLVPPGTAATWNAAAECVTTTDREAHYMGLPAPHTWDGPRAHWVIPPGTALSPSTAVRALIAAGADLDAEEPES